MLDVYGYQRGVINISSELLQRLAGGKIGIVTNQTGVDHAGQRTIDQLLQHKLSIVRIFSTEHGIEGRCPAGQKVSDTIDAKTGIPVVSLYTQGNGFKQSGFDDVDSIIFDMQDVGMRHFTHVTLLYFLMDIAARLKKEFIILDHPSLLGRRIEGPLVIPQMQSMISMVPIPLRYGLTVGELAHYFNQYVFNQAVHLDVIPVKFCYKHTVKKLPVHLSFYIKNIQAAFGYSFLGLLGEVRPFDVGLGTQYPFQIIGFPESTAISKSDWNACRKILEQHHVASQFHRYFCERKKKWFQGLLLFIADIEQVSSFELLLKILAFFRNKVILEFSEQFDKAVGTPLVKKIIISDQNFSALYKQMEDDHEKYRRQIVSCLIY